MTTATAPAPTRTYARHAAPLWKRVLLTRESLIIAVLLVVIGYSMVNVNNFDGPLTMYYLLLDIAPIMLIALPMTMIIITGEIDLSVASTVGLTSVLTGILSVWAGLPMPLAALAAVVVGALAGALNGFLIGYVKLPSLAVTIGTLALYRGIAVGLLGTNAITDFDDRWTDLATDRLVSGTPFPNILVVMIVLIAAFAVLLHYSRFGRSVYDIGLNDEVARFSGVNVERTKFWLFVLSGAVAGFAGVYFTLRYGSARGDNAMGLELEVIAAVLLGGVSIFGGRGALHGVVAGVLLIGVISSAMRLENQPVNLISIVTGVLLILSVLSVRINVWLRSRSRRSSGPGSATRASTEPPAGSQPAPDTPRVEPTTRT